ncbi:MULTISPECIES: hypothetical protein [unclassified Pseudomonas]|uniref:hypothetical protein n=1 Tax=unclassified Pseudomonas TaxID=196821 RepID=UPI0025E8A9F5|nr:MULTISPECIES: hypothetical protein [unclassified Pseudomonas]
MTTQQVIVLIVISIFTVGLCAYTYFVGRKTGRHPHQRGLHFDIQSSDAKRRTTLGIPPQDLTPEGSGHATAQDDIEATPASLREACHVDAQKTKSFCCQAAGIIHPSSNSAEALIPHEKLREAAPAKGTLIAENRPHAQPVEGYTNPSAVSRIVAVMEARLVEQAGTYAASEHMAQVIEAALQQAGFLSPIDESWQVMHAQLDESLVNLEAEQPEHHTVANLKRTITELEKRIMSYTGLAVARADFDTLVSACETLKLALRTWSQMKGAEAWVRRAEQQATDLRGLALRVQSEIRNGIATTETGEAA